MNTGVLVWGGLLESIGGGGLLYFTCVDGFCLSFLRFYIVLLQEPQQGVPLHHNPPHFQLSQVKRQ